MGQLMVGIQCAWALKNLKGLVRPLWEECSPAPLKKAVEKRYAHGARGEPPLVQGLYWTCYLGALAAAGEAVAPESVVQFQQGERHHGGDALYWGLAALIHIQWERWDQAAQAQADAMANYNDCPMQRDVRWEVQRLLCITGYTLKVHNGELEGLETDVLTLVDNAANRFQQVEARLLLGRYYLAVGKSGEAMSHLEYARSQGGATYAVLLADDLLRELEGREPSPERRWRRAWLQIERESKKMLDTCDPRPMLAALKEAEVWCPDHIHAGIRMLEASTLMNLGRDGEAATLLDHIPDQGQDGSGCRGQKLHIRAVLSNRLGRMEEAEELARELEGLLDGRLEKEQQNLRRAIVSIRCTARLKRGETEGLEEVLRQRMDSSENMFDRVINHLYLGRYCLNAGRLEEAREHLSFTWEHGGALYIRGEAGELLRKLSAPQGERGAPGGN